MALENLGEHIRAVRKERGLSQEALARRADLSLNVVARIELGIITNPHYLTLDSIARALDITVEELVDPEPTPKVSAPSAGQPSPAEQIAQDAAERAGQLAEEAPDRVQEIVERMARGAAGQGVSSSSEASEAPSEASSEASAILEYALQAGMLTAEDLEEAREALRRRHATHE
jgi:transcriptional regulator with XRE-family HTH domain